MKLLDYIKQEHGTQRAFALSVGVEPQQVTQWLNKGFIVIDSILYSPRRPL